jgi:hypothetical protein
LRVLAKLHRGVGRGGDCRPGKGAVRIPVAGPVYSTNPLPGRSVTGHTFIQLLPDSGPQAGSKRLVYGFSTRGGTIWRALGGYGEVQDDSGHAWSWRMCSAVQPDKYDLVQKRIAREIKNPPDYHLFEFNCTDWVLGLVREGNISFPSIPKTGNRIRDLVKAALGDTAGEIFLAFYTGGAFFSDPYSVELRFIQTGDGGVFAQTGFVSRNSNNSLPTGILRARGQQTEPDIGSPSRIGQLALRDPNRFGQLFELDPVVREQETREVGSSDPLSIDFDGISDERSMVVVNWGDGPEEFDDPLARHRYRDPGRYRVRVAVLRGATMMRVEFDVVVRDGEDTRDIGIDVPRVDPPKDDVPADADPVVPQPLD